MGKATFCKTLKCLKQFCWDYIDNNLHSDTYWPHFAIITTVDTVDAILWNSYTVKHCTVLILYQKIRNDHHWNNLVNSSNNTARKTLRLFKKQQEAHLSQVGWNTPEPKLVACAHMMWVFWTILGYSINSVPKYHYGKSLPYMLIAIVSWSAYLFDILPVLVLVYLPEPFSHTLPGRQTCLGNLETKSWASIKEGQWKTPQAK